MDGYQYEKKCAELLKAKGFSRVQVTPGSGDQGIDVIAYQFGKKYGVQCKYYEGTVGNKAIQEVYAGAAYYNCDVALVVTSSTLTKSAKALASKLKVEVWENVDAIYLQKHTAEYIEQERILRQKEQERQQQLEEQRRQEERRKQQEEQRKRELAIKENAKAEALAKKREESGEFDHKRQYIKHAAGLIGLSEDALAYVSPDETVTVAYENFSNIGGKGTPGNTYRFHNIRSVVCTDDGIVGLRYDGLCVATKPGFTYAHISECNYWTNIIAIAAGAHHVVGLRSDGTCDATSITKRNTSYGYYGQSDVSQWRNIVQIECGNYFSLGLQSDGHVVLAGKNDYINTEKLAHWSNIKMISAGGDSFVGLTREGKLITAGASTVGIKPEKGILQLRIFHGIAYALYADGSVGCGEQTQGPIVKQKNIISLVSSRDTLCALDKNGKVHVVYQLTHPLINPQKIPLDIRIFDNYDHVLQKQSRREQGACQFCGGTFKGLFVRKCSVCGRRKNY